jgi:hypothetical protein
MGSHINIDIRDCSSAAMLEHRMRFAVFAAALLLLFLSVASAETWHLEPGSDWQALSEETSKALVQADKHYADGKVTKAVRAYDRFLDGCDPASELYAGALDRQFSIAKEFLAGRKMRVLGVFKIKGYAAGIKTMERIGKRTNDATATLAVAEQAAQSDQERQRLDKARSRLNAIGLDAALEVAQNYEQRKKFDLAYLKWLEIFDTYDSRRKDALFGMARCRYLAYEGPEFDASDLTGRSFNERGLYDGAKGCYAQFKSQYPEDAQKLRVDGMITKINQEIALKDFTTGRYYQKTGNRKAANLYYQMVIRDWPGTGAAQMANEMLIRNANAQE